jgi:hypothetical protein
MRVVHSLGERLGHAYQLGHTTADAAAGRGDVARLQGKCTSYSIAFACSQCQQEPTRLKIGAKERHGQAQAHGSCPTEIDANKLFSPDFALVSNTETKPAASQEKPMA